MNVFINRVVWTDVNYFRDERVLTQLRQDKILQMRDYISTLSIRIVNAQFQVEQQSRAGFANGNLKGLHESVWKAAERNK